MEIAKNRASALLNALGLKSGIDYMAGPEPRFKDRMYKLTLEGYVKIKELGEEKLRKFGLLLKDKMLYPEQLAVEGVKAYYMHNALGQYSPKVFALLDECRSKGYLMEFTSGYHIAELFRYKPRDGSLKLRINEKGDERLIILTKREILGIKEQLDDIQNLLYKNKIVHGDIYEGNILLSYDGKKITLIDPWWETYDPERLDKCVRNDASEIARIKGRLDKLISGF
jgi:serine/threonine protein kinase